MNFVFWEDKVAFPGPKGRVGHPDPTQNIGQTRRRGSCSGLPVASSVPPR